MPYFAWKGVNLQARWCKGKLFARDSKDLERVLFKKDVALVSFSQKKLRVTRVKPSLIVDYFVQLHTLTRAGVLLPEGLRIVARNSAHPYFSFVAHSVADQVDQGVAFSQALRSYPQVFSPLIVHSVAIGQESGNLSQTLGILVDYLEARVEFSKKLRAALLLPAITLIFFLLIVSVIMVVIVPQFASLCASMHKQIPASTALLLRISECITRYGIAIVLAAGMLCWAVKNYCKSPTGANACGHLLCKVPVIRSLIAYQSVSVFFRSVAKLLHGGMPLAQALTIASESISITHIQQRLKNCAYAVNAGASLADCLHECHDFIDPSVIALVSVGQETGMLAQMMSRISNSYQERLLTAMHRVTSLIQPFLLIILGLMIGALILGLYAPIMSMSAVF